VALSQQAIIQFGMEMGIRKMVKDRTFSASGNRVLN
jgi:hypothetical protein